MYIERYTCTGTCTKCVIQLLNLHYSIHVHVCTCTCRLFLFIVSSPTCIIMYMCMYMYIFSVQCYMYVHKCTWYREMERKKERNLRQMKKWKMSFLRWDLNPRHMYKCTCNAVLCSMCWCKYWHIFSGYNYMYVCTYLIYNLFNYRGCVWTWNTR